MSDGNNLSIEKVPDQQGEISVIPTDIDAHKIRFIHKIDAEFAQSRELRDEVKRTVRVKIQAQHALLVQKIETSLDTGKKAIFNDYLSEVAKLENQFTRKMDELDQQNDQYEKETRESYYKFFDKAREEIKQWKDNPARYEAEIKRIDEQEQKRLNTVKNRIELIEAKRENILNQTLQIFNNNLSFEELEKKVKFL